MTTNLRHLAALLAALLVTGTLLASTAVSAHATTERAGAPRCGGERATLVGTGRDDRLVGTEGRDVVVGLGGDDVLVGLGGDDLLCGGQGDDRVLAGGGRDTCLGGPGRDRCDGGSPGHPRRNTPGDVDACRAEVRLSCREGRATPPDGGDGGAGRGPYTGTATGRLSLEGTVEETWTATYRVDPVSGVPDMLNGPLRIDWRMAGTDLDGCRYQGSAVVGGVAALSLFRSAHSYALELRPERRTVEVQVDCPVEGTSVQDTVPLNTDAASTGVLRTSTWSRLDGERRYHPMDDPEVLATWQWDARR